MDKNERKIHEAFLAHEGHEQLKTLQKLSDQEIKIRVLELQKKKVAQAKNPNAFWILPSLPPPKVWKTKTKAKYGWIVFAVFILMLVIFGVMLALLAFFNQTIWTN